MTQSQLDTIPENKCILYYTLSGLTSIKKSSMTVRKIYNVTLYYLTPTLVGELKFTKKLAKFISGEQSIEKEAPLPFTHIS